MGEEKNLSETDLISRESGAQFESLPEMTLTTRLILGECQMEIAEILKVKKPKAFFLENVQHLINHDNGKTFNIIKHFFLKKSYNFEIFFSFFYFFFKFIFFKKFFAIK